jgi:acyl carrier protein
MTTEEMIGQLKDLIANELDADLKLEDIDENASLFEEGLGLDSIMVVELITSMEIKFNVEFPEEELDIELFENLRTLAQLLVEKMP